MQEKAKKIAQTLRSHNQTAEQTKILKEKGAELNIEQTQFINKHQKAKKTLKEAQGRDTMAGYGSFEYALLNTFEKIIKRRKVDRLEPRHDWTITVLTGLRAAPSLIAVYATPIIQDITAKMGFSKPPKIDFAYAIEIDENADFKLMASSEGNTIPKNSEAYTAIDDLIKVALRDAGYQKNANGYQNANNEMLTQEKFDKEIAPKLKKDLSLVLDASDYIPHTAGFKP